MKIQLPRNVRRDEKEGIHRAVSEAAERAAISPYDMAIHMTHFLEAIVREVCRGHTVTIQGFGQFGPWAWQGRKMTTKNLPMVCLPRFMASAAFKNEVMTTAVPAMGINMKMHNYRMNHKTAMKNAPDKRRAFTALTSLRQQLMAQARKNMPKA